MGNQLLAGTGLAVDQYRDGRAGQTSYGAEHLLHGRRLADDLGGVVGDLQLLASFVALFAQVGFGSVHQGNGFIHIERLGQVFEGAALVGVNGTVQIGVGGHDDDRQIGLLLLNEVQQGETIDPRHTDIGKDYFRGFAVESRQQAFAIFKREALEALGTQGPFQHPAD